MDLRSSPYPPSWPILFPLGWRLPQRWLDARRGAPVKGLIPIQEGRWLLTLVQFVDALLLSPQDRTAPSASSHVLRGFQAFRSPVYYRENREQMVLKQPRRSRTWWEMHTSFKSSLCCSSTHGTRQPAAFINSTCAVSCWLLDPISR